MRKESTLVSSLVLILGLTGPGWSQDCDPVPACIPPPAGLVHWYPGEDSPADTVGTLDLTLSTNGSYGTGIVGRGFLFDEPGDFAQNLQPALAQVDNWTLACWIDWQGLRAVDQAFQIIFHNGHGGQNGYGLLIDGVGDRFAGSTGEVCVVYGGIGVFPTGVILDGEAAALTGVKHHLAIRRLSGALSLFIDGVPTSVNGITPHAPGAASGFGQPGGTMISRGVVNEGTDPPGDIGFHGVIDEFDVYSVALADAEIAALVAAGCSGKCTGDEDADGDGIPDAEDTCASSDTGDTILIDGVDTGVTNDLMADGCTLTDLIDGVLDSDPTQEEIVQFLVDLKAEGYITGKEMGQLLREINSP